MKTPFTHEYGRFSATKTVWSVFALIFAGKCLFEGMVIDWGPIHYTVTFSGIEAAAVLSAQGGIYAFRRHSESKFGVPVEVTRG